MAASVQLNNSPASYPLKCAVIKTPDRLARILADLEKWTDLAKQRQSVIPDQALENYIDISDQFRICLHSRLILIKERDYDPSDDDEFVVAAYDSLDNLQAIAQTRNVNQKGIAVKVYNIVTAFSNTPFAKDKSSIRDARTCLMQKILESAKHGAIVVEAKDESQLFFEKLGFKIIKAVPSSESQTMSLGPEDFSKVAHRVEPNYLSCEERDLDRVNEDLQIKASQVPLHCVSVEHPERLCKIRNEVQGWLQLAQSSKLEGIYAGLVDHITRLIDCNIALFDPITNKPLNEYLIVAAFDSQGNLQGIAAVNYLFKNQGVIKIDILLTAIWNRIDLPSHKAIKGVGTCLLNRVVELMPKNCSLTLHATENAVAFFQSRGFVQSADLEEPGAPLPMKFLPEKRFLISKLAKAQNHSLSEVELPPIKQNFVDLLKKQGLYFDQYPKD